MSELFGKTPISVLQEYTAKKGVARPIYDISQCADEVKSFVCIVEVLGEMDEGIGRSKKEAKHEAAANILKKLKLIHKDIDDIPQAHHEHIPTSDAVAELRDLCLQRDHPLPLFDMVQQVGPPEAPEFTMKCSVASIIRYATSSTKKGARQLAAQKLIDIIQNIPLKDSEMEMVTLDDVIRQNDEKTRNKFKTYKEYVDSDMKDSPGTLLSDRHNYFKNFEDAVKLSAKRIMSQGSLSDQDTVKHVLNELKIGYKQQQIDGKNGEQMVFIELLTDIDVVFVGTEDQIYQEMLSYFKVML